MGNQGSAEETAEGEAAEASAGPGEEDEEGTSLDPP
jgi:hypothetical protein